MAVVNTATLPNSITAKYNADYILKVKDMLYYDQQTYVIDKQKLGGNVMRGSSVKVPFYLELPPNPTAVPQVTDITPRTMADALFTVTPDLYGDAVQLGRKMKLTAYTEVEKAAAELVGRQAAKTLDYLARTAATQGSWVKYGGAATSRATCDRTNDQLAYGDFIAAMAYLASMEVELINGKGICCLHNAVLKDLLEDTVILAVGEYQKGEILLNGEVGTIGGAKIVVTPWAKRFLAAGAAQGSAISTTVNADIKAGDTAITLAADTNAGVGDKITVGTIESSTTEYPETEQVEIVAGAASPFTIAGAGANGGFQYAHSIGETVKDNDTVHGVVFFARNSIGKLYDAEDGPKGRILPPKVTGLLDQFDALRWRGFWGFGRVAETRLLRYEVASSLGI